ncbi:CDP-diacylglycerol--glycerol-3-phosphate 3-phosphatidyltransferase [Defluviitalea raffinosedens]|jgi:CDP-diacylglycerol--glycerol-3-phosphate 3-phosphatidyltransferase|uniref:CDP-diacylglycerol--glycerol-3-phosphate 3-phosphatidyltransferase n=1 Tax=Defluviitalea raffinosedens TaxID=1450156 RepID=UPI00176D1418|nr:CDP-diacylglycerol--glycerol-3-phosphate 3-phosphatidyltransferase [Defluviitalea raffinosedens]MBM7685144.1 CDP-diacylglycerol--glycerol-3-phosphate 3-phosphatidyltransferase [Defluviitalea raffinosedens]MBZ4668303.1 pgsA 2 [Defluviitaleaceae bacterium]HHW66883.1 CDP-diacylglycerol--glycerol-3-phosphate 3-phosphatidyltransferase [Candidatus Epulonipiscium sp.]
MNLANKLTFLRIILIPVFLIVLLTEWIPDPQKRIFAVIIFALASLTDMLDGYIARSRNLITNLGKFLDPLADKLLVTSALVSLVELGDLPAWVVIIILSRELAITGFRTVAVSEGIVIAASWWGKIKTISQMFMIMVFLLNISLPIFDVFETVLMWMAVIFTIISGVDYIVKNKRVLSTQK